MFLFTVYWTRIRRASVTDVYKYFYSTPSTEGVCLFVRNHFFLSLNIQKFDDLDHANHIFSESISCWQPVPPCSYPVLLSTNQYRPLLTQYSMIWWFRPCKPNIFWKHITLATSTALFWSSITKYRPVPPYTDPVPPSNNQYCPPPTKYKKYQSVLPNTGPVSQSTNK